MSATDADWYWLWFWVVGVPLGLGWLFSLVERRPPEIIPYRRVNDCKPGAFLGQRDFK